MYIVNVQNVILKKSIRYYRYILEMLPFEKYYIATMLKSYVCRKE